MITGVFLNNIIIHLQWLLPYKMIISLNLAIQLLGIYPTEILRQEYKDTNRQGCTLQVCGREKLEITQMFNTGKMVTVYLDNLKKYTVRKNILTWKDIQKI